MVKASVRQEGVARYCLAMSGMVLQWRAYRTRGCGGHQKNGKPSALLLFLLVSLLSTRVAIHPATASLCICQEFQGSLEC